MVLGCTVVVLGCTVVSNGGIELYILVIFGLWWY